MNSLLRLDPQRSVLVHIANFQACSFARCAQILVSQIMVLWLILLSRTISAQEPTVQPQPTRVQAGGPSDGSDTSKRALQDAGDVAPTVPYQVKKDLVYRRTEGKKLAVDVYWPSASTKSPVVVMIHGGAWVAGDKWNLVDHARELAQAGFVAMNFNYRLAPEHKYPAQIEDARAALQWAIENAGQFNGDADRIAVWGYSAGGQLAALLSCERTGKQSQPLAAVLGGPPCEFSFVPVDSEILMPVFGGTRKSVPEIYRQASPTELVNQYTCPTFIFHGTEDRIVPPSSSRIYAERLRELGLSVSYLPVEGQGHLLAFLNQQARRRAIAFLNEQLSVKQ